MLKTILFAAVVLGTTAGPAFSQHPDIWLTVQDDRIVTSFAEDFVPGSPRRVFTAGFGDSGCDPFTANPGFNSFSGTFGGGSLIGWNALDGFEVWNGAAFEPAGGEFLVVSFFALSFTVADAAVNGFELNVPGDGGVHVHLDFEMNGAPLACTPPAGADPGIYLLNLEITNSMVNASPPFWIVFNYLDQPGADVNEAVQWVKENLACHWDMNLDGLVGIDEFLTVLGLWGTDPGGPPDFDDDGVVGINDFLTVLGHWGPCP